MIPTDPQWERRLGESTERLHRLGLPHATEVYRRPTGDGQLWALLAQDDRGWTLVVTHTALDPVPSLLIPGRLPTLIEIIAARRQLIPPRVLLVVLLTRAADRLLTQMQSSRPGLMPRDSGLPTTVRCVEAHIEFTDDVVLGAP
jgi:hypothetical protein